MKRKKIYKMSYKAHGRATDIIDTNVFEYILATSIKKPKQAE